MLLLTQKNAAISSIFKKSLERSSNIHKHSEKCILGHSVEEIYSIVADVERYDEFLPWCQKSLVHSRKYDSLQATLQVGFFHINESYRSNVLFNGKNSIITSLGGGCTLLRSLKCSWKFQKMSNLEAKRILERNKRKFSLHSKISKRRNFAKISFHLEFAFANPMYSHLCSVFLDKVVNRVTRSFEERCRRLNGQPSFARLHV